MKSFSLLYWLKAMASHFNLHGYHVYINVRIKENLRNTRLYQTEKSALAAHSSSEEHDIKKRSRIAKTHQLSHGHHNLGKNVYPKTEK